MAIIKVNDVTKEYRLGQVYSIRHTLSDILARLQGKPTSERARFKALDGIGFQVDKGEIVGIIGSNGAGKSTALKLLAQVTRPTSGTVEINGSVAPLIELGAGLMPELTGRENIYLNGSILGIPRRVLRNKFDDIVAFAELEEFIDTPIKRYSSGMKVRLGFSIATSVEADILIVDEVLAVGDLAFQRKCFDRMEELINREGTTVLLVSHNIRQVERICDRVILLEQGRILADDSPDKVCALFYKRSNEKIRAYNQETFKPSVKYHSSEEFELQDVRIVNDDGEDVEHIESNGTLRVRVRFEVKRPLKKAEFVVGTHTTDFMYLSAASTGVFSDRPDYQTGIHEVECIVPWLPLTEGSYCVRVAVFDQYKRKVFIGETLKIFDVISRETSIQKAPLKTLDLPAQWKLDGKIYEEKDYEALSGLEGEAVVRIKSPQHT